MMIEANTKNLVTRFAIVLVFVIAIAPGLSYASSEQIECSSESLPASWTHAPSDCNGLVACDCVDHTDDISYIQGNVLSADHTYNFGDPLTIGRGDSIDSVVVTFRYKVTSNDFPLNKIRVELIVSSDTVFGTAWNGNTLWTNRAQSFVNAPAETAWTLGDLNALRVNMTVVSQNGVVANNVSRLFAVLWFTPGSTQQSRRRRLSLATIEIERGIE